MLPQKLSFVDIETTGMNMRFGKIIEIGIVRVENNAVIKTYNTLINPEMRIDPFIVSFTGITQQELEKAPTFSQIHDEILEMLESTIFVAHNVRFDYGFLRSELKRCGISFTSKHFCTVKLSRILCPAYSKHSLDDVITRFNIDIKRRHRAFDDAQVVWEFYAKALIKHGQEMVESAIAKAMKRPAIPLSISEEVLDKLPQDCGVYIFYDKDEVPLYVGKSINVQERVLSHFASDYLIGKDMKIAQQVERVESIVTAGELGALLLESSLIKKLQPIYNRKLRLGKKQIALIKAETADGYMIAKECYLEEVPISQLSDVFGIFKSKKQKKDFLKDIQEQYHLCPKLLGIENTKSFCFSYHLGSCKGACKGLEKPIVYNLRFSEAFFKHHLKPWPFEGPIMIRESMEGKETFVFDQWCHVGNAQGMEKEYLFDYDTYKILLRYLSDKKHTQNIKQMKSAQAAKKCFTTGQFVS